MVLFSIPALPVQIEETSLNDYEMKQDFMGGLGFGLRQHRWSLDYAAAPMGELGSARRFSAAYRW